jgi:RNA polymerase sigma factor (sigma-70 family)
MTSKSAIQKNIKLRKYLELINKIVKAEYKAMGASHLVEFDELINMGIQTVDLLTSGKADEEYSDSYLATAIKWAIRNELRRRYRWHGVKTGVKPADEEREAVGEAVYKTILSTDEMMDSETPYEVSDERRNPEENVEFSHMAAAVREAISALPARERELIESKFFRDKKLQELSDEFEISPSRISRIIKSGLDKLKDELIKIQVV